MVLLSRKSAVATAGVYCIWSPLRLAAGAMQARQQHRLRQFDLSVRRVICHVLRIEPEDQVFVASDVVHTNSTAGSFSNKNNLYDDLLSGITPSHPADGQGWKEQMESSNGL